ncbi:unnamed protein product [Brassicogethes aeneus]|uniref:SAM domain-containing protein n=1 Tax=Brassicogethes aeneus TaxID=1431903 RepID=A0A9P0AU07_BRAAE|nr:unnamed protein product [Brassicogethes aeneus]
MEDKLRSWGLSDAIITVFKENEIDEQQLPYLTTDLLKELIPHVGPRLIAQQKILELKLSQDENQTINKVEHRVSSMSTVSDNTENSFVSLENVPIVIANTDDSALCGSGFDYGNILSLIQPKFDDFDLKTLLATTALGKSILSYYAANQNLDNTRRNRLVSIIVKHLYNYIVKKRLSREEYNMLAAKIISIFPTETLGVYYCPPIRKGEHPLKKSVMAKGKLVNQVRNILFRSGDTTLRRTTGSKRDSEGSEDASSLYEYDDGPSKKNKGNDNNEDILWLQHNFEPWEKVLEKWKNTYHFRMSNSKVTNVTEYFALWPVLHDIRGDVLISLDFERLYPQSQVSFYLKWNSFFEQVLKSKIGEIRDVQIKELHKLLLEKTDEDEKLPIQLTLLGHLLPPRGRTKNWKFSILESIEGIIIHVENPGDIEMTIQKTIEKAYDRKLTVQPYLLVEGNTIDNIRSSYLVFDKIKYQFNTVTKAFDLLFKSYHALNIQYPPQSAHILQLIQNAVYNIFTKYDTVYPENLDILRLFKNE